MLSLALSYIKRLLTRLTLDYRNTSIKTIKRILKNITIRTKPLSKYSKLIFTLRNNFINTSGLLIKPL